jgi:hypothetical protein
VRVLGLNEVVAGDPGLRVVAETARLFLKSVVLDSEVAAALALAAAAVSLEAALDAEVDALDAEVEALDASVAACCAWYLAEYSPPATGPEVFVAHSLADNS